MFILSNIFDGREYGWLVVGMHEKLGPGLAGKLGSVLRLKSCISSGNLITVILTQDSSPDPPSSSPEILVRTLLLLLPRF